MPGTSLQLWLDLERLHFSSFFLSILPLCEHCDDAGVQEVSACYISSLRLFSENVILAFKSAYTQNWNRWTWRHGIYLEHKVCIFLPWNSWGTAVLYIKTLPVPNRSSFQFCAAPSLPLILLPSCLLCWHKVTWEEPPQENFYATPLSWALQQGPSPLRQGKLSTKVP